MSLSANRGPLRRDIRVRAQFGFSMRILAFHPGAHDASAAAFDDYRLLAAVQEERLTRQKGSGDGVPWLAIDEVLRIAGWTRRDVDAIASTRAFYPAGYVRGPLYKEIDHALRRWRGKEPGLREMWRECQRQRTTDTARSSPASASSPTTAFAPTPAIFFANHHEAHALPALFFTDWQDALVFTADGIGDNVSYSMRTLERRGAGLPFRRRPLPAEEARRQLDRPGLQLRHRAVRIHQAAPRGQAHRACRLWRADARRRHRAPLPASATTGWWRRSFPARSRSAPRWRASARARAARPSRPRSRR